MTAAADRMGKIETTVANLAASCETKLGAIDTSLRQQAKAIADSKNSYEKKLEEFGAQLLDQIHALQASAQLKRRMTACG